LEDISEAIDVAAGHVRGLPNVLLIQGDISRPPLPPEFFDHIVSLGVLHHTPSTRAALEALYRPLRLGAEIAFTIYRKKAPIREFADDCVRTAIKQMSPAEAWKDMKGITELGRALSQLNAEIDIPQIKVLGMDGGRHNVQRLIFYTMLKCYWRDAFTFEENVHVNYDWYYPQYAWRHTPVELRGWFAEIGAEESFFHQIPAQLSFRACRLS